MAPNASSPTAQPLIQQLPHLQIVDRLVDQFPLVNSALDFANARYVALKSSSALVGQTLDRAEKSFAVVVSTAVVPVLNQLEQPIHYADNKAVQGLDIVQAKIGSLQKSSGELKDTTLKVLDQTKERIQQVKTQTLTTVQAKVHSVLTMPGNVVPLVDQILSAGEHVLDYLLPDVGGKDEKAANGSAKGEGAESAEGAPKDSRAVIRLIFVRMRTFTDKVQRRVVDYSRDRWIPALFSKAVLIKGNLSQLVANGNKLLANGHSGPLSSSSSPAQNEDSNSSSTSPSNASPVGTSTPNQSPAKSPKKQSTPNSTSSKATSTSSPSSASNGDVKTEQSQQQPVAQS